MKAGDAIHICNALRECAESLELEWSFRKDDGELELSDTLRGALVELTCAMGVELGLELGEPAEAPPEPAGLPVVVTHSRYRPEDL